MANRQTKLSSRLSRIAKAVGILVAVITFLGSLVAVLQFLGVTRLPLPSSSIQGGTLSAPPFGATATATLDLSQYATSFPGPGCGDTFGGTWAATSVTNVQCEQGGGVLVSKSDPSKVALVSFTWPNHPFPLNYAVTVEVSHLNTSSCGGVGVRTYQAFDAYSLLICGNGAWYIVKYTQTGVPTSLASGYETKRDTYSLDVSVTDDVMTLTVNEGTPHAAIDSQYRSTAYIALFATSNPSDLPASVVFQRFGYAPHST